MASGHGRYEEMAVGHVLGGLSPRQSADFRNHLHSCGECRSRVAELHSIADDLAAAEREERTRAPVRTEVAPREGEAAGEQARRPRIGVGHVTVAVVVVLALATAMAFWNLHLRSTSGAYLGIMEAQGEALERLASGVELDTATYEDVVGRVVTDGSTITVTLAGLEQLGTDERLVAWFLGAPEPDQAPPRVLAGPGGLDDGAVAASLSTEGARELTITREVGTRQQEPQGPVVLEARLVSERVSDDP